MCLAVIAVARAQEAPWYLQAALDHHRVDMCGLAPQTAATRVRVVLCAWRVVPLLLAAPAQSRCHRAHLQVAAAAVCRLALVRVRVAQAVRSRFFPVRPLTLAELVVDWCCLLDLAKQAAALTSAVGLEIREPVAMSMCLLVGRWGQAKVAP